MKLEEKKIHKKVLLTLLSIITGLYIFFLTLVNNPRIFAIMFIVVVVGFIVKVAYTMMYQYFEDKTND